MRIMTGAPAGLLGEVQRLIKHPRRGCPPDRDLLERYTQQRDEAAFGELVRRYAPLVLGVCQRVLGQPQDAEDAFQATFLVLSQKPKALRRKQSVASWHFVLSQQEA